MVESIGIIGGGPAGIIAAGYAGSRGKRVSLIEKNDRLGKKLFITGKGRCNITNFNDVENFFPNIVTNSNFLYGSFYSFTNEDIIRLLESYGLDTKVERGDRVFPTSNKSSDVVNTFSKFLKANNVDVILNKEVRSIEKVAKKFLVRYSHGQEDSFDKLVIATGGKSYPQTGSTGDGYEFAKSLGHSVQSLKPALVGLETKEDWVKEAQGLSLRNVSLKVSTEGKKIYEDFGEMIFTHYGISGPIVLSASSYINKLDGKAIKLSIDLKPALSKSKLDNRLLKDFEIYQNKQFKNGLNDLLPRKIIPIIIKESEIDEEKPIHQITKEEREKLVSTIKNLSLHLKSLRPIREAIVTSGGISTKEIDPSTMESKLVENLYFAGEIIDVDALTGGYNLQIAYSTGYLVGINV